MNTTSYLQQVAAAEPWRLGLGQPRNALDPAWVPGENDALCGGELEWEHSTGWWTCLYCGYIGSSTYTGHKIVYSPFSLFIRGLSQFIAERAGTHRPDIVLQQALFVAGVSLKYAAPISTRMFAERVTAE